jgi:hypothetical protein
MLNRVVLGIALAGIVVMSSLYAQQAEQNLQLPDSQQSIEQKVRIPGTSYEVDFAMLRSQPGAAIRSPALLNAIVTWLSIAFELPTTDSLPVIALASKDAIAHFGATGALSDGRQDATPKPADEPQVLALYDALDKTVYLPEGWVGGTPAELAMLVHEMVHHLQHAAHLEFACPQEREALAYAAQERWGVLFGRNVNADLGLDPLRVALISSCIPY